MEKLVILGGGESGVGTAILGTQKEYKVFVSDFGHIQEKYKKVLDHHGIEWEEGVHSEDTILDASLVMKSPGIPDSVDIVQKLRNAGIPVISEIEFAARYTNATIIGITGSNGKTTTTMLIYHILRKAGFHVGMAGNIGDSFAKMVAENDYDFYVLEISSFQLDGIQEFRPHHAIITNITPDHLDRYNYNFDDYTASKFRITINQKNTNHLIYDADDEVITSWMASHPTSAQRLPFSLVQQGLSEGAYLENDNIYVNMDATSTLKVTTNALSLQGKHNIKNTMAAITVANLVGIKEDILRESLQDFQSPPHRLEKVLHMDKDIPFINDSKATNVDATYYALDSMTTPTVWIVGGVDKGNDYQILMPLVEKHVKAIVCLGLDNSKIKDAFSNVVDLMVETQAMSEAVKMACQVADRGDTVLLSPACASFDLFKNYIDRGNQFKEAVANL